MGIAEQLDGDGNEMPPQPAKSPTMLINRMFMIACTGIICVVLLFNSYASSPKAFWKPQSEEEIWCDAHHFQWRSESGKDECALSQFKPSQE